MAVPNIKKASGNGASTTLSSSVSDSATAAPLTSDTKFDAKAGEGMVIIGEETATPEFAYASGKSGSSLTIPLVNRGLEGGSAVGHASGETVKGIITAGMWNDFADAYEVEHNDDGTHKPAAWVGASDAATITFDLSEGTKQRVTMADSRTLALSNVVAGHVFILKLTQPAGGSKTVTWFSTISWAGGTAPTLTTTANKADVFGFIQTGTNTYDGFVIGQNL